MAKCEPFGFLVIHHQAKCIKCLMVGDNIKELLSEWPNEWPSPPDRGGNLNNYRG